MPALSIGSAVAKVLMLGTTPVQRVFVGTIQVWADEVVSVISGNVAQMVLPGSYFSAEDWANPNLKKRLRISTGANVWSYTNGVPALDLGTGRSGALYVDVQSGAYVLGHAGVANGGTGGTAIKVRQNQCWINNAGYIYGGGGAGGAGGQGGPGYYNQGYTAQEGPYWTQYSYDWQDHRYEGGEYNGQRYQTIVYWAGTIVYNGAPTDGPFYSGGYTYYKSSYATGTLGTGYYYVYRTYPSSYPVYTTGGAGGTGGKGAGYNSSLTNGANAGGSAGAAGGTNAGTGGTGGTGGGWGAAGNAGATGNSGNNGGGSAGTAGGLGGLYIDGNANLNGFTNTGSVLGRVA